MRKVIAILMALLLIAAFILPYLIQEPIIPPESPDDIDHLPDGVYYAELHHSPTGSFVFDFKKEREPWNINMKL